MNSFILKFKSSQIQTGKVYKIVGAATLRTFVDLITNSSLEANPRTAKIGRVTDEIQETLETYPELFPFMSKGVLFAARKAEPLERERYKFTISDPYKEGILDGGHNTLAIGRYVLSECGIEAAEKIKNWEDLKRLWSDNLLEIENKKKDLAEIIIPVEVIYPAEGPNGIEDFEDSILQISAARNNNAQLKETAKANQAGLYEELKSAVDQEIKDEIEWKENEGGRIKSPDIVALSLIAISVLPEEKYKVVSQIKKNPNVIFSSKGQCVKLYNEFMQQEGVSKKANGDRVYEVVDPLVKSALMMMGDIPALYDKVYKTFPRAYNDASPGFGRISCVRTYSPEKWKSDNKSYMKTKSKTKFFREDVEYDYPDGFIYPLVVGLSALMEIKSKKVIWKSDPDLLIDEKLSKILSNGYQAIMKGYEFDPAKVGKEKSLYELVQNMYRLMTGSAF